MFANRLRELFDNKESALALGYLVGEKGEMPEDMQYSSFEVGDMTDPQLNAAWEEAVKLAAQ